LVESVLHPVIVVSDMETALRFYRDLLGLRVISDDVHDPALMRRLTGYDNADVRAIILECPDRTEVELAEFRRPRGQSKVSRQFEDAGLYSVTFTVRDLEHVIGQLTEAGYHFTSPSVVQHVLRDGAVVGVVYCIGPDGVLITLAELPKGRRSAGVETNVRMPVR
jgi:catechol 2,3-dioxygenase-like lactoylglutathione lyase family enzyme